MINITAKDVQTLRQMTGAGVLDCRNALLASKGDIDGAKELIRKKGQQIVDKKAGRETNQGLIGTRLVKDGDSILGQMAQVFCETDFVARNEDFQLFVRDCLGKDTSEINAADIVSRVGENIQIGQLPTITLRAPDAAGVMTSYVHNKVADDLGTIGVLLSVTGEKYENLPELGHRLAMHVAAMNPKAIDVSELDETFIENERRIFTEQAKESGKPDNIIEKMVEGRLRKSLKDVCLVDQAFVMDQDKTVGEVLAEHNAEVIKFVRLAIGE